MTFRSSGSIVQHACVVICVFILIPLMACGLQAIPALAGSTSDICAEIESVLSAPEHKRCVRTLERLIEMEGVEDALVQALEGANGKRCTQLSILLVAVMDFEELRRCLLSDRECSESGSLSLEILALAFLERVLAATEQGVDDPFVMAVVDRLYQDPNWRTRYIASRLLSTVEMREDMKAFVALRQDNAWPVQAYTIPASVVDAEHIVACEPPDNRLPSVCEVAAQMLSRVDALFCDSSLLEGGIPDETLEYKVRAKLSFLRLRLGTMVRTITCASHNGSRGYHIHQKITVGRRYQQEDAYIDAQGLFPYEYKLVMKRPGSVHFQHTVLWDHFGGKVYLRKIKNGGAAQYAEWDLGMDEPADSRDPLSAMLLYCLMCSKARQTVDWDLPILMSRDERYHVHVGALKEGESNTQEAARWDWNARDCDEMDKVVTSWFSIVPTAIPVRYAAHVWGVEGSAKLIKHTCGSETSICDAVVSNDSRAE